MKKRITALILLLCMLLSVPALAVPPDGAGQLTLLQEADEYIRSYYLLSDGVSHLPAGLTAQQLQNDPELFQKTMDELVKGLDKYSHFFTAEEYELAYPTGQSYVGVGVKLDGTTPYGLFMDELIEDGSAGEAGLLPGDQIVRAGGADVSGKYYEEASAYLRGEAGTTVEVSVLRPGESKLLTFMLERRALYVPNVTAEVDGDTAVMHISQFGSWYDYVDFQNLYDQFPAQGVRNLIIDLRDNPGGDLDVLWGILDYMVKGSGRKLFTLKTSHGEYEDYFTQGACEWTPERLVLLVNEYSASASEVFSGALKDLGAAVLVGQPTYGKARAQTHIPLSSGDMLVLTTYTVDLPKTGDYQDAGVTPNHIVENREIPYELPESWTELGADYALFPATSSAQRIMALETHLSELGVFRQEPDGVYDWYTAQCVTAAQKAAGLTVTSGYASKAVLAQLVEWMEVRKTFVTYQDDQMSKALELCGRK